MHEDALLSKLKQSTLTLLGSLSRIRTWLDKNSLASIVWSFCIAPCFSQGVFRNKQKSKSEMYSNKFTLYCNPPPMRLTTVPSVKCVPFLKYALIVNGTHLLSFWRHRSKIRTSSPDLTATAQLQEPFPQFW